MCNVKSKPKQLVNFLVYVVLGCWFTFYSFPVAAQTFPSAGTTGITDMHCPNWDQVKTNTSGRTISVDGTVIANEEINGRLLVKANNVTIRCVKINAGWNLYGIQCNSSQKCPGLLVEDTEIFNCGSSCGLPYATAANPSIWRRVHLHTTQKDLFKATANVTLEDSYLHGYQPISGAHNDAIQTSSGENIVIRGNRIEGPFQQQTSAYIVKTDHGPIDNVLIENNWLSGGTATLYLRKGTHGSVPTNVTVRNNVWVKNSYKFLLLSSDTTASSCLAWSNNVFDDGSIVPGPGSAVTSGCGAPPPEGPGQVATPSISPNGGSFINAVTVTLDTITNDAEIYYTLDGSAPTTNSTLYSGPFTLSASAMVKAMAVQSEFTNSLVRTASFSIDDFLSDSNWQNVSFAMQTGTFTAEFDVIPSNDTIDGVTGLSAAMASGYNDLAVIIRFATNGQVDARNGSTYQALNVLNYTAGTRYHVLITIDITSHRYSATVTPQGGSPVLIADNYAFRSEQNSVSHLSNLGMITTNGTHNILNFLVNGDSNSIALASPTNLRILSVQ